MTGITNFFIVQCTRKDDYAMGIQLKIDLFCQKYKNISVFARIFYLNDRISVLNRKMHRIKRSDKDKHY